MINQIMNWLMLIFGIIFAIVIIIIIPLHYNKNCCMCGSIENNCCPCPAFNHKDEVVMYYGYKPSSAGSWEFMCRQYNELHNTSYRCFE